MDDNYDKVSELLTRASVSDSSPQASTDEQHQFRMFADAMTQIHGAKAIHYGDYIKTHGSDTPQIFATEHYCDIKRKYVRAKTFVERMTRGEAVDFTDLLDTYSDLAVYAIMGLQMAFHCREKMDGVTLHNSRHPHSPGCHCDLCRPDLHPGDYIEDGVLKTGSYPPSGRQPGAVPGMCVHGVLFTAECETCKDEEIPF